MFIILSIYLTVVHIQMCYSINCNEGMFFSCSVNRELIVRNLLSCKYIIVCYWQNHEYLMELEILVHWENTAIKTVNFNANMKTEIT